MADKKDDKKGEQKGATAPSTPYTSKASLEKKLTTKVILGKKVHGGTVENGPVQLYSIIGICSGAKVGESQYGGWVGFTGTFEAIRFSDGARFISPVAFVPEPASSMISSALDRLTKQGGDVSLRFAFIVGAKVSDKAAGFEYTVEPVQSAAQNDALADLREMLAPRLPQLSQSAAS